MTTAIHNEETLEGLKLTILDVMTDLKIIFDAKNTLHRTAFQGEDAAAFLLVEVGFLLQRAARFLTESEDFANPEMCETFSEALEKLEMVKPFVGRVRRARLHS